jgi:hypothetical protein
VDYSFRGPDVQVTAHGRPCSGALPRSPLGTPGNPPSADRRTAALRGIQHSGEPLAPPGECRITWESPSVCEAIGAAYGAGAPCAGTAGAGGVPRAARSTPMTAPTSHNAKATDAMPPLQKPVSDSPATA